MRRECPTLTWSGTILEDMALTPRRGDDDQRDLELGGALQVTKFHPQHQLPGLNFSAGLVPKASRWKSVQSAVVSADQASGQDGGTEPQLRGVRGILHSNEIKIWVCHSALCESVFSHLLLLTSKTFSSARCIMNLEASFLSNVLIWNLLWTFRVMPQECSATHFLGSWHQNKATHGPQDIWAFSIQSGRLLDRLLLAVRLVEMYSIVYLLKAFLGDGTVSWVLIPKLTRSLKTNFPPTAS